MTALRFGYWWQSESPAVIHFFTVVKEIDMDRIFGQREILDHILYLEIVKDIISYQISQYWILYPIWYEKDIKR